MDDADSGLERSLKSIYQPVRRAHADRLTQPTFTQNSGYPQQTSIYACFLDVPLPSFRFFSISNIGVQLCASSRLVLARTLSASYNAGHLKL